MATTQLTLFNDALGLLGLRSLVSTSDATEPARVLTALWDQTRRYCLEQGRWRFAERQATLSVASGQVASEPAYGLAYAYAHPADYVTLNAISADSTFTTPVDDVHERGGYWYTNTASNVYIQYISNDAAFGYDLDLWPENFVQFYIHYLALRAAPRLSPSLLNGVEVTDPEGGQKTAKSILEIGMDKALEKALRYDAVQGPSTFLPSDGEATQLTLFNDALSLLGLPSLVSVTDANEHARVLVKLWDQARRYCLEQARWRFAERQATLTVASGQVSSEPAYALLYAYAKPSDFVTLNAIASDLTFDTPVDDLHERGGYWYTDTPTNIHIQYVSNHADFGYDLSLWPENFVQFFTRHLALRAAPRIAPHILSAQSQGEGQPPAALLKAEMDEALARARQYDTVEGPSVFLPGGVTSQLSIFNNAMWLLRGRSLVKVTDAGEAARTLLMLWNRTVDYCLAQGHWKFAEDQTKLDTPSVVEVPTYGLQYAFDKPDNFIRINEISADEYFQSPIFEIHDRGDYIYTDIKPIYLRFVSKASTKGYDLTRWPETFTLYVTLQLATMASSYLAPELKQELIMLPDNIGLGEAKRNALAKDAVEGPTKFLPQGDWAQSRSGRHINRGRNSRSSLYGS